MNLSVSANSLIIDLIQQFHQQYPFLRLEIYHHGEEMSQAIRHCRLEEIAHTKKIESFKIHSLLKVTEVEKLFWEKMGIQIAIFRKSGKTWLESSYTNDWSLERQNSLGQEMNDFIAQPPQKLAL